MVRFFKDKIYLIQEIGDIFAHILTPIPSKGQKIAKKKYVVLYSSKKRTLGQFYVLKIAQALVFWKNPGRHNGSFFGSFY